MPFACWIIQASHTHSECVILIAFLVSFTSLPPHPTSLPYFGVHTSWRTDSLSRCWHGRNILRVTYCNQFLVFFLLALFSRKDVSILKLPIKIDTRNRQRKPHGKLCFLGLHRRLIINKRQYLSVTAYVFYEHSVSTC